MICGCCNVGDSVSSGVYEDLLLDHVQLQRENEHLTARIAELESHNKFLTEIRDDSATRFVQQRDQIWELEAKVRGLVMEKITLGEEYSALEKDRDELVDYGAQLESQIQKRDVSHRRLEALQIALGQALSRLQDLQRILAELTSAHLVQEHAEDGIQQGPTGTVTQGV